MTSTDYKNVSFCVSCGCKLPRHKVEAPVVLCGPCRPSWGDELKRMFLDCGYVPKSRLKRQKEV